MTSSYSAGRPVWLLALGIVLAINLQGVHTTNFVINEPTTFTSELLCEMSLPITPDIGA